MSPDRRRAAGAQRGPARPRRRAGSGAADAGLRLRFGAGRVLMLAALVGVAVQLLWVQTISAPSLSAESASQRTVHAEDPALRGSITDRHGNTLAASVPTKDLSFQPVAVRKRLADAHAKSATEPEPDRRLQEIAKTIHDTIGPGAPKESDLLATLRSDKTFAYLARRVDARVASRIKETCPEVAMDRADTRNYPGGVLAANMLGVTGWDGHGIVGLESSMDSELAGTNGSHSYDQGSDGTVIPGSERDRRPAVDGSGVELTIDSDLQYYVQQQVQEAKQKSGAKDASAVVLDAHTGQVLSMGADNTFNPQLQPEKWNPDDMGDPPVSSSFEPGSVNKVITAASAIEYGVTNPNEVHQVPGSINMGGVTVNDAWSHGVQPYTTTGVFGKSSNVGTLMLAQRVGADRFADMAQRFGLGQRTDVGLPNESPGFFPPRDQWSGATFANLPIGQGLSMSLLQMTGMYQAIANDGVRIPPRIVNAKIGPDGKRSETEQPEGVRVVSPQTAQTLRGMFQAAVQDDPQGVQEGTGPSGAVDGYQIAGKTGTAQKVDPDCQCYLSDRYWITFAGIAPANDPRYVVGIMLNEPQRSTDGSGGQSAAPLFHNIASWALQRDRIPPSPPSPPLVLQAD